MKQRKPAINRNVNFVLRGVGAKGGVVKAQKTLYWCGENWKDARGRRNELHAADIIHLLTVGVGAEQKLIAKL